MFILLYQTDLKSVKNTSFFQKRKENTLRQKKLLSIFSKCDHIVRTGTGTERGGAKTQRDIDLLLVPGSKLLTYFLDFFGQFT